MAESTDVNILELQKIIKNYEHLVEELNKELQEVKDDHKKIKTQLSEVFKENNTLAHTVEDCLKNHKITQIRENNEEIIENLRKEIDTIIEEKQCVTELWQNCVKTIEYLEGELKIFQSGNQEYVPKREVKKIKLAYEEKIGQLEIQLSSAKHKLDETVKQASSELEIKHSAIDHSLETQAGAFKIIKNLESEVFKLQNRLKETNDDNVYLEKTLQNKEDIIQGLRKRNSECMSKVTEAISVIEAALNEKDAALFREKQTLEDNQKLVDKLNEVTKECEDKIKSNTTTIKNEHFQEIKNILQELKQAQNETKVKEEEIENLKKKIANFEHELQRIQAGDPSISKLLILEKNLESTFQKLLLSEKQNIQLTSERDSIKNDMEQITNLYERNIKAKEIETATLHNKIKQLNMEINESREELNVIRDKMVKLNEKILLLENEFKNDKEMYKNKLNEQYTAKIEEQSLNYNENIKNLQSQIQTKDENNKKWRQETKLIITNLEKVVSNLKQEIHRLKKENFKLKEKLNKAEDKIKQYKLFLELISNDVNKISNLTIADQTSDR